MTQLDLKTGNSKKEAQAEEAIIRKNFVDKQEMVKRMIEQKLECIQTNRYYL